MLFDTTFLIDLQRETLRKNPGKAFRFLEAHPEAAMQISAITYGEIAEGFLPDQDEAFVEVIRPYEVLEVTAAIGRQNGWISRGLRKKGDRIGDNDLWIAATALEAGLPLVTRHSTHFQRIPGLRLLTY